MLELKGRLRAVAERIPSGARVVLLDYPVHFNVGDLLIHMGEEAFFRDYGIDVIEQMNIGDVGRYDRVAKVFTAGRRLPEVDKWVEDGAVLLIHGGGNIGDIYPHYEAERHYIISRYRNAKIIIMPQSIHYGDPEIAARAAASYGAHPDLFVFVRDEPSLKVVRDQWKQDGMVVPDMAHQLWGSMPRTSQAGVMPGSILVQRRRDDESTFAAGSAVDYFDWDDMPTRAEWFGWKAYMYSQRFGRPSYSFLPRYRAWKALRDQLVERSVERYRRVEKIETDRLHGLILSSLLAKDVTFADNSYGKLSRYAAAGLKNSPLVHARGKAA